MREIFGLIGLFLGCCVAVAGAEDVKAMPTDVELCRRALVDMGNPVRVQRVLAKAARGETVVVGVLGGSITAGAAASTEENRWGNRVAQWWRTTFPGAKIEFVNAGIGATGSDLGAHRVQRDLLGHKPDFVVVEYAVNDGGSPICAETLEGVVRQILSAPNAPACMLLYTMNDHGQNTQAEHERVARHYGLPAVSFRDAMWPEVEAGHVGWKDIEADAVHPNDRGHELCAKFVAYALEQARAAMPSGALPEPAALPAPLTDETFAHTRVLTSDTTQPVNNSGWTPQPGHNNFGPGWTANVPGSTLELEVEGTRVALAYHFTKGDTGMADAWIDDGAPVTVDAYFPDDWGGGYTRYLTVASNLSPGKHTLHIRLLEKTHPDSKGHEFNVDTVCLAGLP